MKIKNLIKPKNFEIPPILKSDYYIEIFSGKEIVLSGFSEIEILEDSMLRLKINEHHISVYGKQIEISFYTNDGIKILGNIERIEFL